MIEGLKLDFNANELNKHLEERVLHHQNRIEWHRRRLDELKQAMAEDLGLDKTNNSNRGIVSSEEAKMQEHNFRARYLEVVRKHLLINETYRLEEADMLKLELVPRAY